MGALGLVCISVASGFAGYVFGCVYAELKQLRRDVDRLNEKGAKHA